MAFGTADAVLGMFALPPIFHGLRRQFRMAGDTVLIPLRFLRHLWRLIRPWVVVPRARLRPGIAHDGDISSGIFGDRERDGLLGSCEETTKGSEGHAYHDDCDDGQLLFIPHFPLRGRIKPTLWLRTRAGKTRTFVRTPLSSQCMLIGHAPRYFKSASLLKCSPSKGWPFIDYGDPWARR